MPEGDTIHRVAAALRPILEGAPLRALRVPRGAVAVAPQTTVQGVAARGKHLLVTFGPPEQRPRVLRVHLGMNGRWRWDRVGARAPVRVPHVLLATDHWEAVCVRPPQAVLYPSAADLAHDPAIASLGPDLLADDFDVASAVARARETPTRTIADVLLDQRVACGIGNVYKSEVLFIARVDPCAPVATLDDATLAALYTSARQLMRQNLGTGPRVTALARTNAAGRRPPRGLRHWVYRRAGRPCPRCRTLVVSALQGPTPRRTYWCPRCQQAPETAAAS